LGKKRIPLKLRYRRFIGQQTQLFVDVYIEAKPGGKGDAKADKEDTAKDQLQEGK